MRGRNKTWEKIDFLYWKINKYTKIAWIFVIFFNSWS